MDSLISIVVAVYNIEKYLPECIESLINQTYTNIEILLVDDGSTDGSGAVCDDFSRIDSRIRVIHQENGGISSARNTGVANIKGDYLMFVDGDDWIDLDACEIAMKQLLSADADIALWSYVREYPEKSLPRHIFFDDCVFEGDQYKRLLKRVVGPYEEYLAHPETVDSLSSLCNKLFKVNDDMAEIRFIDTKLIGNEDLLYNIQAFLTASKAVYINKAFYHYRKSNTDSYTHSYKNNLLKTRKALFDHVNDIISPLNDDGLRAALKNRMAVDIIAQGLNVCKINMGFRQRSRLLKEILKDSDYRDALKQLDIKFMPIHWKVFFLLAKAQCVFGVLMLIKIIMMMRTKV